jgi:CubicO group peptidase (beta-lactamase class C family)
MNNSKMTIKTNLLLLLVLASLYSHAQSTLTQITTSVEDNAKTFLEDHRFNSISIAVKYKGIGYVGHFGELDKGKANTPNNDTLYEIASVTKTMTGYLVAKAVIDNKIKLSDPVTKYLGDTFRNLSFNDKPVTIEHLLTHTSGLPLNIKGVSELYTRPTVKNFERAQILLTNYSKDSLLEDVRTLELNKVPGTVYSYSNVAPNLLANILEIVYDKPFETILKEHLFIPAGMKNSMINLPVNKQTLLAQGYNGEGYLMPNFKRPIKLWGGAGRIKSTSSDLLNFIAFQLEKDNLIVKETRRKLFKDTDTIWIGYYWELLDDKDGLHIEHHGGIYGSQNWLIIYPKYDFGISIITNTSFPETNQILKRTALNILKNLEKQ